MHFRRPQAFRLSPFLFFGISFFLFSFNFSGNSPDARAFLPVIFWTLTLFTVLFFVESAFQEEWERGILDLWVLYPRSFSHLIILKFQELVFYFGLPLAVVGFIFFFLSHFSFQESLWFCISFILGLLSLILIGLMVSCFKLGGRGGVLLIALLLLPLYLPVLILGLSVCEAILAQGNPWIGLKGLLGFLLLNFIFCAVFGGWALKQAIMR